MEEADNILDLEGSRYILDGEHVVPAIGALEFRILRPADSDGLRREHVMHRDQDAADLVFVDIDVSLRGLGRVGNGDYREHEYDGPFPADAPRVEVAGHRHVGTDRAQFAHGALLFDGGVAALHRHQDAVAAVLHRQVQVVHELRHFRVDIDQALRDSRA